MKKRYPKLVGDRKGPIRVSEIGELDALLGRGTGPNENPGNYLFRETLKKYCNEYRAATCRKSRRDIISAAVEDFQAQGGRFLQRVCLEEDTNDGSSTPTTRNSFEVLEGSPVLQKARQAFRYLLRGHGGRDTSRGSEAHLSSTTSETSSVAASLQEAPPASVTPMPAEAPVFSDMSHLTSLLTARSVLPSGLPRTGAMMGLPSSAYSDMSDQLVAAAVQRDLQARSIAGSSSLSSMLPGISSIGSRPTALMRSLPLLESYPDTLRAVLPNYAQQFGRGGTILRTNDGLATQLAMERLLVDQALQRDLLVDQALQREQALQRGQALHREQARLAMLAPLGGGVLPVRSPGGDTNSIAARKAHLGEPTAFSPRNRPEDSGREASLLAILGSRPARDDLQRRYEAKGRFN